MSDRSPMTAIASALLVVSAVTGYFVIGNRLQSMRPARGQHWSIDVPHGQTIDARLWQDPLGAIVASGRDTSSLEVHLLRDFRERLGEAGASSSLHILPVMIPSGSYVEESELRRRYRVAVVSALMSAAYVPASTEHIGVFNFEHADALGEVEATPIAYEWFHRSKLDKIHRAEQPDDVLVMWLPERALGDDVLGTIEQIVATPLERYAQDAERFDALVARLKQLVRVRVIGPSSSDGLAATIASCQERWELAGRKPTADALADEIIAAAKDSFDLELKREDAKRLAAVLEKKGGGARKLSRVIAAIRDAGARQRKYSRNAELAVTSITEELFVRRWERFFDTEIVGKRDPVGQTAEQEEVEAEVSGMTKRRNQIVDALAGTYSMYSPRATVPDRHLLDRAGINGFKSVADLLGKRGKLPFYKTICSDEVLAGRALEELDLRGVHTARDDDHIALIVERDTLYGRTLERTFESALTERIREQDSGASEADALASAKSRVEVFSYLRGLDGSVSGGTTADRTAATRASRAQDSEQLLEAALKRDPPEANEAFGPGQFDRIMQLGDTIERLETVRGSRFHAIGIVGSDIYDKLAVVQALRPRFQDKVFFTTDMDARLIPTPSMPLTRNLVVISGYGDELHHHVQRDTPPFRDCYQSSIYLATLLSVADPVFRGVEKSGEAFSPADLNSLMVSRAFEIGRTKAIGLDGDSGQKRSLHPDPVAHIPTARTMVLWALYSVIGFTVASFLAWRMRRARKEAVKVESIPRGWFYLGFACAAAALVAIAIGVFGFELYRSGEPFYLAQGVSLWPTEIVRTIAAAMALSLLWVAIARIDRSDAYLHARVFPKALAPKKFDALAWPLGGRAWLKARKCVRISSDEVWQAATTPDAVWHTYKTLGLIPHRLARIAPFVLLFTTIALVVLFMPPTEKVPFRGAWAAWTDRGVAMLVTWATITLSMFIIDSARLSTRFIGRLCEASGDWSDSPAQKDLCKRHNVEPAHTAEHLLVEAACHRAATVGNLIWFPLVVMAVILFGQYSTFDAWGWPVPFVLSMMLVAAGVFGSGVLLLKRTEAIRGRALRAMHERLAEMRSSSKKLVRDSADRHERILTSAKEITSGTFGGLRSPVLDAVLLPSGGLAAMTILELAVLATTS